MVKLPIVKTKKLIKVLEKSGFFKYHQVGSHAQFKHPDGRRTTIPIHQNKDIPRGTLKAILQDAKITDEEFIELLRQ
jgi:predicted RNA binding protein YcfA (HicA-like mRNA interferase family)